MSTNIKEWLVSELLKSVTTKEDRKWLGATADKQEIGDMYTKSLSTAIINIDWSQSGEEDYMRSLHNRIVQLEEASAKNVVISSRKGNASPEDLSKKSARELIAIIVGLRKELDERKVPDAFEFASKLVCKECVKHLATIKPKIKSTFNNSRDVYSDILDKYFKSLVRSTPTNIDNTIKEQYACVMDLLDKTFGDSSKSKKQVDFGTGVHTYRDLDADILRIKDNIDLQEMKDRYGILNKNLWARCTLPLMEVGV